MFEQQPFIFLSVLLYLRFICFDGDVNVCLVLSDLMYVEKKLTH